MSRPVRFTRSKAKTAKDTKPPPKIMLQEIPHHLVYKILYKIPCFELIRMRKTCSYVSKTVEEHKEAFSKRVDVGVNISLQLEEENNNTLRIHFLTAPHQSISMLSQFEDHFSGVSFKKIHVTSGYEQVDQNCLFVEFLRRLNRRCVKLSFFNFDPLNYLIQLSDLVESRTTDFGSAPCAEYDNEGPHQIQTLQTSSRKSTFALSCQPQVILEQLEQLTNFKKVSCFTMTAQQIHTLVTTISNLTDLGSLQKICFCFISENPFLNQNFVFPVTKLLWEMDGIRRNFAWNLPPNYIYKLNLTGDQCAIISLYTSRDYKKAVIRFVNNTSEEILKILISVLRMGNLMSSDKKIYLESSEDEQVQVIRQIYEKRRTIHRSGGEI